MRCFIHEPSWHSPRRDGARRAGHETPLIATIAAGLVFAFGFGPTANRLRISPLIGYRLAGILVGPLMPGYVADQALANQLAEIGVILLLFDVGGIESLVSHSATMNHASMSPDARSAAGISDSLIRLSIGLENEADLASDLTQALEAVVE